MQHSFSFFHLAVVVVGGNGGVSGGGGGVSGGVGSGGGSCEVVHYRAKTLWKLDATDCGGGDEDDEEVKEEEKVEKENDGGGEGEGEGDWGEGDGRKGGEFPETTNIAKEVM
ncbi:Hypothetical predicted protein [Octopus vulgaris]|uniref:Uncharacterized protein n=1 Tax=Octopus vulgaris TaxID=6645 RepID=A0AA36FEZ3_OCTVU|nr:Hypothetical predicted protein [Octopus vulgaris]